MRVEEITRHEGRPEVEDLIPEVREIQRRRRLRALRLGTLLLAAVVVAGLLVGYLGGTSAPPARTFPGEIGPGWSTSLGTANIPKGLITWPSVELISVSCASEGNCVAVGDLHHGNETRAVVVAQHEGTWGRPLLLGPKPSQASTELGFVSCVTPANCLASSDQPPPELLVSEVGGRWSLNHRLRFTPASSSLFAKGTACSSDGQCWLILSRLTYADAITQTYAIGEKDGHWKSPLLLGANLRSPNGQPVEAVLDVRISCAGPSSCTAIGLAFYGKKGGGGAFVQSEVRGKWGPATSFSTTKPDRARKPGSEPSISQHYIGGDFVPLYCTSSTSCLMAGTTAKGAGAVEQEVDRRWLPPVTGIGTQGPFVQSDVTRIACYARSECAASGYSYTPGQKRVRAFVQIELRGRWLPPLLMRGLGGTTNAAIADGVECPTPSTCDVIGWFDSSSSPSNRVFSFEASYTRSGWHYWIVSLLGQPDWTSLDSLSCVSGHCWVVGTVYGGRGSTVVEGVAFPFSVPT